MSLRSARARSAVAILALAACVASCSSAAKRPESGVIDVPTCRDDGSCVSAITVGGLDYVVSGIIKAPLAESGQLHAVGRAGLQYDRARTIRGEDPTIVLSVHYVPSGHWLVAIRGGAEPAATAALCRVVPDVADYSQCKA